MTARPTAARIERIPTGTARVPQEAALVVTHDPALEDLAGMLGQPNL